MGAGVTPLRQPEHPLHRSVLMACLDAHQILGRAHRNDGDAAQPVQGNGDLNLQCAYDELRDPELVGIRLLDLRLAHAHQPVPPPRQIALL
jgi:hypothetical protein